MFGKTRLETSSFRLRTAEMDAYSLLSTREGALESVSRLKERVTGVQGLKSNLGRCFMLATA